MKIVVLNGSPKGDLSVTLQYANFLAKAFPQHEFKVHHIAQRIKAIEAKQEEWDKVIADIQSADGVLWAFPLYILLVHAHYKRFIELVFERGAQDAFAGKYAASLSTSIHFYDQTAHEYIRAVSEDLGMRFVESYSPEMTDLLEKPKQATLVQFGAHFLQAIQNQEPTLRQFSPLIPREFIYEPGAALAPVSTAGKKVVIVHDSCMPECNLARMVERCRAAFSDDVTVVNLHDVDIKASCQGCLQCGAAYHCAYEGKDGFIDFYQTQVMAADILVFAGSIRDRYLSSRWKMCFDRSFFNTHTPVLVGKQLAFVISGPFSQLPNLKEVLTAWAEYQGANLVGFVGDEFGSSEEIDAQLNGLMARAAEYALQGYMRPQTFLGIGGGLIFRDDIYGRLRPVFKADHQAYVSSGFYDTFPQRHWRTQLLNAGAGFLLSIPRIQQEFRKRIKENMVAPLKQVVSRE